MNWREFARINQVIEHTTPTKKISTFAKEWEFLTNKEEVITLLSLDLEPNNLKSKKALKWIINALDIFEEEISIYIHGDIGEAVYYFNDGDSDDSTFGLTSVIAMLNMDCSKSDGESYTLFKEAFLEMSALEQKWFLRYWLRTPRNGIKIGLVRKLLAKVYKMEESEVKKHNQLHSLTDLVSYYERKETPPNNLTVGRYISPMLAKAVPKSKWPKSFLIEYKYDGARYQIHRNKDRIFIFNRKGVQVTEKFPDIAEIVKGWRNLPACFIIDTEIFPIDLGGQPKPFKYMGTRIHMKDIAAAIEKCPVKLAVFDCMMYDVENLLEMPLRDRLEYITKFPEQAIRVNDSANQDVFYNEAINDGYEGIMIKDLEATYHSGKRSSAWAKHKPPRFELDVVITGARYGEGRKASIFASFDIAVSGKEELISIGSVGNGFSDMDLLLLTNQCKKIITGISKGTYEVLPRHVLEVTCDLITMDNKGSYGLRFPRLVRMRQDKPVSDIATVEELKAML